MAIALIPNSISCVIRDLRPEDLGLRSWAVPPIAANTPTAWIRAFVSPTQVIGIYKVLQLSANPKVSTLELYRGARMRLGIHELESCYGGLPILKALQKALLSPEARQVLDRMAGREPMEAHPDFGSHVEAYFSEPYVFGPNDTLELVVTARQDTVDDYLVLGGFVAERHS